MTTTEVFVRAWLHDELIELSPDAKLNKSTGGSAFVLTRIGEAFVARAQAEGNKFGAQHRTLLPVRGSPSGEAPPEFNAAESPLGWLWLRRDSAGKSYISEAEFLAGERLRADFTLAMLTPKSSASWPLERVDCSRRAGYSPTFETERAIAARARFWEALDSVGHELASVLIGVCCHLERLEAIEMRLGLPKRAGKTVLKLGLKALARHYGLMRGEGRSQIRSMSLGVLPAE